jgi:hypothetical protein
MCDVREGGRGGGGGGGGGSFRGRLSSSSLFSIGVWGFLRES